MKNPSSAAAERQATSNRAAFLHWLQAVHGLRLEPPDSQKQALRHPPGEALRDPMEEALRAWAEADPAQAAPLILRFAGDGFASARLAAGLLLQADLRPDDRLLTTIEGVAPDWLPQALRITQGHAPSEAEATVLVADSMPHSLPPGIRRVILIGPAQATAPPGVTLSRSDDWTYPRESSAD